jgi:hypothetical protein
VLYHAVDSDNTKSTETHSLRLKVFSEDGKKYADIEIPYFDKDIHVEDIHARTIGPDGKVTEFADQIYDREIIRAKKFRFQAKVLTLPNVQVGSILEYSYRLRSKDKIPDIFRNPMQYRFTRGFTYPAAEWAVQRDLFTKHAHFTLHPVKGTGIHEYDVSMPKGVEARKMDDGTFQLDMEDVPAYEEEQYSPPEDTLKMRVNLFYAVGFWGPTSFWEEVATQRAEQLDHFVGKSKAIEREAARLISPADSPETKMRKIYARVQQIRAVSYENEKTDKELKRENLKENKNAEDVLNRGYAYGNEINLLFIALARAAGLRADPVLVTSRKNAFFMKDYPSEHQLNAMLVEVMLGPDAIFSNSIYLDPATRFCPYGLLPWEETDAGGIRIDAKWPAVAATPVSKSTDAVTRRKAELRLKEDGKLEGEVEVSYFGQEALSRRLEAMREDAAGRQKDLEDSIKNGLPQGATVKLLKSTGWENSEEPLTAEFEIEIANFATAAGRRLVFSVGVFHTNQETPFPSARRVHPIYFGYPQESYEEVKLELPPGMQPESIPDGKRTDQGAAFYEFSIEKEGNTLRIKRVWRLATYFIKQEQYPLLKVFYGRVMSGDSQSATLRRIESARIN